MFLARSRTTTLEYLITDDNKRALSDPDETACLATVLGPPIEVSPATLATFRTVTGSLTADDEDEEDEADYASDDM